MRAVVYTEYGSPDVLRVTEVKKPSPKPNEILVRIHATTVSAGDWRMRKADPFLARLYNGLFKPKRVNILGFELSGEIEEVGEEVRSYKKGDQVFAYTGIGFGAYAEYICLREDGSAAIKPPGLSHEEAAAVPVGGMTALNFLRRGKIEAGKKVLVYGASGSVGTYAVQLAKAFGADVTAVCSAANVEMVKSIGADRVIDYTKEDFRARGDRYDLIFDAVGRKLTKLTPSACRQTLRPNGAFVHVNMSQKPRREDLIVLQELLEAGRVRPVIDRRYSFERIPDAHRYVEQQHKKGNVVVTVRE